MTTAEFFKRARRGRTWKIRKLYGLMDVRCADGYCPLGAVARLTGKSLGGDLYRRLEPDPVAAAKKIGLNVAWAWRIARAADQKNHRDRPWLLKNLGVGVGEDHPAL